MLYSFEIVLSQKITTIFILSIFITFHSGFTTLCIILEYRFTPLHKSVTTSHSPLKHPYLFYCFLSCFPNPAFPSGRFSPVIRSRICLGLSVPLLHFSVFHIRAKSSDLGLPPDLLNLAYSLPIPSEFSKMAWFHL